MSFSILVRKLKAYISPSSLTDAPSWSKPVADPRHGVQILNYSWVVRNLVAVGVHGLSSNVEV